MFGTLELVLRGEGKATDSLKILGPLGAGGFGAVYEALDQRTGQHVAVKQLDDTSADSIARFKHEFRALADCHHENLVGLRELIEQDGRWLIVMELVPGTDFLRYVRRADNDNEPHSGAAGYDEGRLRKALVGMVQGLRVLHEFGVVHRDLKPSNVRVRPDGRAVLLDFGLATSVDPKKQSTHGVGVGTVVYMAPEQAGGISVGPAADMYALGVCLFEALTGRVPFEGSHAIGVMLDKQRATAPRARSFCPSVPQELDELCARLLNTAPEQRPSSDDVLSVLTRTPVARPSQPFSPLAQEPSFAGRDTELAHLARALALTNDGEQRLVLVEGESGVGKSELVAESLRRAALAHPHLLALRGRCYENEQVSYKAFDGCIDELASFLRRLPERECAALLPERAGLLGQLFPVLRKVPAIALASREGSSADPTARRLEAFAALSRLLSKIAEERPLVLVIDDLQWADSESFRLLHALHAQEPRPPILLLATLRPRKELEPDVRGQIDQLRSWQECDVTSLFGLPGEQAKSLARQLMGPAASEHLIEQIARESQGHPLFMAELVRYTRSHEFNARGALTIDAALQARVDGLDRGARELLEIVALAARPYPSTVFAAALSREVEETVRKLLAAKLLRQRRGHEVGCFHDRIRHAAVGLIARARLPVLHHQLASALEELPSADASEKAQHWDLAGKPERASGAYEAAARNALESLAFTRAAELLARAIALLGGASDDPHVGALITQRAEALAWAGRSAEAALLFQQAAQRASGEQRIQLRSDAAVHAMIGAQIGPGIEAASQLIRELGFSIPKSRLAWLLRFGWDALRVRFSRIRIVESPANVSESERIAVSAAGPMLRTLAVVHTQLYFGLLMQFLYRAAKLGFRPATAQALIMRGWLRAMAGSIEQAKRLFEQAIQLTEGETDPAHLVVQHFTIGSAHMVGLDWTGALPHLLQAERIAQEQCPQPWLLTITRYHLGAAWYHSGMHADLARESERWLSEARERNDLLGTGLLVGMGHGFLRHLMRDDPQAALQELAQTISALPQQPYSFAHVGDMIGGMLSRLYAGGSAALHFLEHVEAARGHEFVMRGRVPKEGRVTLRMLATLSAYAAAPELERSALLASAKKIARSLRGARSGYAQASLALALAQIHACDGQLAQALASARDAVVRYRALNHAHQHVAEYVVGVLEGGAAGQRKRAAIVARLREQGWREPLRMLAMNVPALGLLAGKGKEPLDQPAQSLADRYEVIGPLGRGGFGRVVAARDLRSGRNVALKELVRKGGASLERFKQEFRVLAEIHHEHIVQLEELFEHDGAWYIAMERVDGVDLASYVRTSSGCDPERLKQAAIGLTRALSALHQKGFVHRDVKPDNVLVTEQGRAVLIDFGLIARSGDARDAGPVGSLQFAAPEQLQGVAPSPDADVYALGVSLQTVISGTNPFADLSLADRLQNLPSKQAAPFSASASGLEQLCVLIRRMLSPDPVARPLLPELLRLLEGADDVDARAARASAAPEESGAESAFRGRERELAWLAGILDSVRKHGLRIALVEGESGLGKSALVAHCALQARERGASLEPLRSRCYEHERVAFKAFDGVVDQLALLLRELPSATCEALLPKRAVLLAQLFPVLSTVPAIASAPKKGLPADPTARKQAGLECFIRLLENVAAQRELLLIVDDLQWADEESFDLLQALARVGERLPIAILCTVRPPVELEGYAEDALSLLRALPCCEVRALEPLDRGALTALADQLLDGLAPERLAKLVEESAGHPLFLRELIEQERRGARGTDRALTLDGALGARVESLEPGARDLLVLIALADKPHGLHVYARALELDALPRDALIALLGQGLLQRRGDRLACHHDRIRRVVIAGLSGAQRTDAARRLARALSQIDHGRAGATKSDAAERARLWDEAGDAREAIAAYEQAGDQALDALAFARAEQHYARALQLSHGEGSETWQRLQVSRGQALVRSGRSADAAQCFRSAAQYARGDAQVRLRVWAAQHLILSAQVCSGMQAARELLAELGIALPETEGAAKRRIVWERARVALRGIELKQGETSASDALALDALHGLSAPVRAVSLLPGSALVTQYLRRALDAGDPHHAARALSFEALLRVLRKPERSQEALFERSSGLAAESHEHALIAEVDLTRGLAAIAQGRFDAATRYLWRAQERLISHCPGQPWLLSSVRMQLSSAWFYNGQLAELHQTESWLQEARARDDRYAFAALTGFGYASLRHALDGDPERGLAELEEAGARWPSEPLSTVQLGMLLAANPLYAVCRSGPRYLRALDEQEARLARSSLIRVPFVRFAWIAARFSALLSCLDTLGGSEASELIRKARSQLRVVASTPGDYAANVRGYFSAWLHVLEGKRELARDVLRATRTLPGESALYAPAMLYLLGRIEAGDAGRALCAQAVERLRAEGWRNVHHGLAMRLPVSLEVCERLIGLP